MTQNTANPRFSVSISHWPEKELMYVGLEARTSGPLFSKYWELPELHQRVVSNQIIACFETEKSVWEIASPCSGTVQRVQEVDVCLEWSGRKRLWLFAILPEAPLPHVVHSIA